MDSVLMMFSGGRDSILASCILLEQGYNVKIVTYDTGHILYVKSVNDTVAKLMKRYRNIEHIGIESTTGIYRSLITSKNSVYNSSMADIVNTYGDISMSQLHCLYCRTAMYIKSMILAKQHNCNFIAEGARRDQKFMIEQYGMIYRYEELLSDYGIKLLVPLLNCTYTNAERNNQLLLRDLPSSYVEPKCVMGVPFSKNESDMINSICNIFDKLILPDIKVIYENCITIAK